MIYNQWYVILESREVKKGRPLKVRRLNMNLVLWRSTDGKLACIEDQCCHRGASLGCGRLIKGELECPFHGFLYDGSGSVTQIPAQGKNQSVPEQMRVKAYPVFEEYGLIWIWWGDPLSAEVRPFFFEELKDFSWYSYRDLWKVHYSRAIENQLDVIHLPFVHKTTIGRGHKTLVNGPVVERDGNLLTFYVDNSLDDGQTIPLKPDEIRNTEQLFKLQFYFPNIWQNYISGNIRAFAAFVPVDEEQSIIYIRYYQRMIKIPILKAFMNFLGIMASILILKQDKKVVETQLPRKSQLKMGEKLIQGDLPIIEYRKYRQELISKSSEKK